MPLPPPGVYEAAAAAADQELMNEWEPSDWPQELRDQYPEQVAAREAEAEPTGLEIEM
jgi:hypothetical protein